MSRPYSRIIRNRQRLGALLATASLMMGCTQMQTSATGENLLPTSSETATSSNRLSSGNTGFSSSSYATGPQGMQGIALVGGHLVGTIADSNGITHLSAYAIDANGAEVMDIYLLPGTDTVPPFGPSLTHLDLALFQATLEIEHTACNGTYRLVIGYFSPLDSNALVDSDTIPLPEITAGIDCGRPLTLEGPDTLWHPMSAGRAYFDLVLGVTLAGSAADATKDINLTSEPGVPLDGVLGSATGATFAMTNANFETATEQTIALALAEGVFADSIAIATGDVVVVKLPAHRTGATLLLQVLEFDEANADKTTAANTGRLLFQYKR